MPRPRRTLPLLMVQSLTRPHWELSLTGTCPVTLLVLLLLLLRGHSPVGGDTSVTSQPRITDALPPLLRLPPGSAATQSRGPAALGVLLLRPGSFSSP